MADACAFTASNTVSTTWTLASNLISYLALEVRRPVELLEELRALQRDLDELGDSVAAVLLERAERCFLAWEMDKGERYLEQALSRVQESLERQPETQGAARWFNVCALTVA